MAYDPALRRSVVTDLRRIETLRGDVPRCLVEELASDIGAHPSTLWRWLQTDRHHIHHPNSRPRRHPDLTEEHITVVFQHLGNLKAAKAAVDATHPEIAAMSESTFRRRWQRIDPAIRAMATQGATGVLDNQIRQSSTPPTKGTGSGTSTTRSCPYGCCPEATPPAPSNRGSPPSSTTPPAAS